MNCIKTSARVYLVEYDQTLAADIFRVGDCLVLHFNMSLFDTADSSWGSEWATHAATIGSDNFWRKEDGILVVPQHCVEHLEK